MNNVLVMESSWFEYLRAMMASLLVRSYINIAVPSLVGIGQSSKVDELSVFTLHPKHTKRACKPRTINLSSETFGSPRLQSRGTNHLLRLQLLQLLLLLGLKGDEKYPSRRVKHLLVGGGIHCRLLKGSSYRIIIKG